MRYQWRDRGPRFLARRTPMEKCGHPAFHAEDKKTPSYSCDRDNKTCQNLDVDVLVQKCTLLTAKDACFSHVPLLEFSHGRPEPRRTTTPKLNNQIFRLAGTKQGYTHEVKTSPRSFFVFLEISRSGADGTGASETRRTITERVQVLACTTSYGV